MTANGPVPPWHPGWWQRLPPQAARILQANAEAHPFASAAAFPAWYLQRWHFLPAGYLSAGSVAAYDRLIRPVYNVASEGAACRAVVRMIRPLAPRRVVEIGCGPGRLLSCLADALPASSLVGVDLSPYMVEHAASRLNGISCVRLVHASADRTGLESGSADAVVAAHFLGHLPESALRPVLAEASRLLSPGGLLLTIDHRWHSVAYPGFRLSRVAKAAGGIIRVALFQREGGPPLQSTNGSA